MKKLLGSIWSLIDQTMQEWNQDDGNRLAAAAAYYGAFSFFPLLLVLTAGLGFVLRYSVGAQDAQRRLILLIAQNTSVTLAGQMSTLLAEVKSQPGAGGPIGLIMLLLGAAGIFAEIDNAFARIWNVPPPKLVGVVATLRYTLVERLMAFVMLLAVGLLVVAAFLVGLAVSALQSLIPDEPSSQTLLTVIQIVVNILFNSLAFGVIYKVLPKPKVNWRDAFTGALVAAIVWEIGRQLLAAFIVGNNYNAYGLIGSFIALMAWIYYACTVLFMGAEFVQVLCRRSERLALERQRPPASAPEPGRAHAPRVGSD